MRGVKIIVLIPKKNSTNLRNIAKCNFFHIFSWGWVDGPPPIETLQCLWSLNLLSKCFYLIVPTSRNDCSDIIFPSLSAPLAATYNNNDIHGLV